MYSSMSLDGYWRALLCGLWLLLLSSLFSFPSWLSVVWARCGGALAGIWFRARFWAFFAWLVAGLWLCPPIGGLDNGPAKQADDWFGCLCLPIGKLLHPKDAEGREASGN